MSHAMSEISKELPNGVRGRPTDSEPWCEGDRTSSPMLSCVFGGASTIAGSGEDDPERNRTKAGEEGLNTASIVVTSNARRRALSLTSAAARSRRRDRPPPRPGCVRPWSTQPQPRNAQNAMHECTNVWPCGACISELSAGQARVESQAQGFRQWSGATPRGQRSEAKFGSAPSAVALRHRKRAARRGRVVMRSARYSGSLPIDAGHSAPGCALHRAGVSQGSREGRHRPRAPGAPAASQAATPPRRETRRRRDRDRGRTFHERANFCWRTRGTKGVPALCPRAQLTRRRRRRRGCARGWALSRTGRLGILEHGRASPERRLHCGLALGPPCGTLCALPWRAQGG